MITVPHQWSQGLNELTSMKGLEQCSASVRAGPCQVVIVILFSKFFPGILATILA